MDRPVLTQDANQRNETPDQWLFTKYDSFGRVVYTGIFDAPAYDGYTRQQMQQAVDQYNNNGHVNEKKLAVPDFAANQYYTSNVFPDTGYDMLTISFYDTYNFELEGGVSEDAYTVSPTTQTKGLVTGNKTRVLGTEQWITTVLYYDEKARPVYTYSHNDYLDMTDKVKQKLDFTGNVLEMTTVHLKDGVENITATEKFTYDHTGRLLKHTHQVVGHPEETLAENVYDELGQLVQKKVGNNPIAPLQTVDYSYNIRGWLQQINDINNIGNDLFGFRINYDDPVGGTALYNGNISQVHWRTNNTDNSLKNYNYSYDALNRITGAIDNTGNYNLTSVSYDKNGNILSLSRNGHLNEQANAFGIMDDLTYSYDSGNKLLKVEDTANDTYGFKDDAVAVVDASDDYTYDENGNMISDTNKEITSISYNHLNLPVEIVFNDDQSQKISYFYSADGVKQQKVVTDNAAVTTTDYATGYIYENGSLKFISQSEGYIEPDGAGGYDYVYQYKDHLGNIRLSYCDTNGDGQITGPTTQVFTDGFESQSGWESVGSQFGGNVDAYDTNVKHSGTYSAKVTAVGHTSKYVHSNTWIEIDNAQPTEYMYSAWAYSDQPVIRLGLAMKTNEEVGYLTDFDDIKVNVQNQWVYVEKKVLVPANIDKINVRIESFYNGGGNVWFDDVQVRRVEDTAVSEIREETNYYPFGLKHRGYNNVLKRHTLPLWFWR